MKSTEFSLQERPNLLAWLVFHIVAIYSTVSYWLRFKRICSWHRPNPICIGGNPFDSQVTHGICRECLNKQKREILSHKF